jgi:hypothetical protein
MAATILSGTGNVSWTNNTGGNVRVVINYFGVNNVTSTTSGFGISMNAANALMTAPQSRAFGKTIRKEEYLTDFGKISTALPTEVYIPNTRSLTLTLTGGTASYNILILPEDG